ncbi:polysaccharide deacetylase family protein [Actinoplanes siamensis]|uniref:NodB homology domain-containing protein n=1 Tax=Actinoplanes siamensis TaxID=1223317 RepID=A0A919TIX9_9ACTN|nr:polysaccharide deacetylase family protein [Actinoplanes siamensis]GIF04208.1 hypothetical protein Asi03nite_17460 [Actinoplanes siamensis]
MSEESTGGTPPEEATIALPAGTGAGEATAPIRPGNPDDEPTVAMSANAPADEPTVAMPADAPAEEATVAMPADTPAEEATVAMRPAAAPVPERPVQSPSEPVETATSESGSGGFVLSRRRLLLGLSGVAGVAVAATAVAVRSASSGSGEDASRPTPAQPVVVTSRAPESTAVSKAPAPVQRRPISTLADYAKATGGPAFPTDAVALTIDDGPHPVWTPKILKLLDKYQVPAMFCMIGNQVLGHEDVARMVTRSGHQLANHTWSHPTELGGKSRKVAQAEIHKAQTKISKTTGYEPRLFRSPGGDWSPQLLWAVAQAGLLPLDWSNDPRDWSQPGASKIEHRMLAAQPGQILLCHDGGGDRSQTYQALSVVIPALQARGLRFVAL